MIAIAQREAGKPLNEAVPEPDLSPEAAALRVRAFLDWNEPDAGAGFVGPMLYYGDLRILAEAVWR